MTDELVHLVTDRGVAWLTLDSPANRNALSTALVGQLRAHLDTAASDDRIRAVVLTHTGSTFCAGADLAEARHGTMTTGARSLLALLTAIVELPKPVVCRIAGHVRAGGTGLVAACDVAVADARASFGVTEARIGLAPAVVSAVLLPRLTPRAVARYYLTGETFSASAAEAAGLITEAVEGVTDDTLSAVTEAYLDTFRLGSPQGLRESKALATRAIREDIARDGEALVDLSGRLFGSAEAREGMTAFLERRPASWVERRGAQPPG